MDRVSVPEYWNQSTYGVQGMSYALPVHDATREYFYFYFNPINNSIMSVKELAVRDIKDDLRQNGLCFLAFREDLDPIMDELVQMESEKQLIASIL